MLIIWCSADAATIRKIMAPIVGPSCIPHKVVSDTTKVPHREPGDVVLACGSKALQAMVDARLAPKGRSITSLQAGALDPTSGFVVTFDPKIVEREYERKPDIEWAIRVAIRLHNTGTGKPSTEGLDYSYVDSLHEVIEFVEEQHAKTGKLVPLAVDIETLGLDEYDPRAWIIAISFTVKEGHARVLYFERDEAPEPVPDGAEPDGYWQELWEQINWLLTTPKVATRGANFKYDSRWIKRKWGITVTNFRMDTFLVGSLLDENRSNSLKLHAKVYTDIGGYEDDMKSKYDMARLDLVPKDELLPYVAGDTDATLRVSNAMLPHLLRDKKLADFYVNLLHPSSTTFQRMETNGVLVDAEYTAGLAAELESELSRLDREMKAMIPRRLAVKYADNFSLGRPDLLREFLFTPAGLNLKPQMFTEKEQLPSTSHDHLILFLDVPEAKAFINAMHEANIAAKTLSTYVLGFMEHLRSDGRFHSHYRLGRGAYEGGKKEEGAVTGRTSATAPAFQTLTKHNKWAKKLRRMYIAPPGKVIIQVDYSQGELKITACLAEEPTMLQAYLDKKDLHAITAANLNGYTLEQFMTLPEDVYDELRSGGKAGNFGLIYGMQAPGFRQYALTSYGVSMTEAEAVQKREAFFALYPRLLKWHAESISKASLHGQIRSPLGRVRHLPLLNSPDREARSQAQRQAINSPVQSTLSDLMQWAMTCSDREYGHPGGIELCMMTHDSCGFYAPAEDGVLYAKRFKEIADNLPIKKVFGWDHQLPLTTDAELSVPDADGIMSLASLKKLKGL